MDGVRRIEALQLADVVPGPVAAWRPRFQTVSPYALLVDAAYQRDLTPKSLALIGRIVAGWDWARFKPPIVAETAPGFEVIDGQHTAIAAATHPDVHEIPVMIVEAALTAAKAGAFVGHNRDRLAVTRAELHKALVAAGDPRALAVGDAAAKAGIAILSAGRGSHRARSHARAGDCMAVGELYGLLDLAGAEGLAQVLAIIVAAELAPINRWHLRAVRQLLFDKAYAGQIAAEAITEQLRDPGLQRAADILTAQHRLDRASAAAVVIFRKTRHGRRRAA